jgi:hypothetical protein
LVVQFLQQVLDIDRDFQAWRRQWVLSLPYRLRYLLAWDHASTAITTSPAAGSATMRAVVVGSKTASRAFNHARSSIQ